MRNFTDKMAGFLGSRRFYLIVLGFFIFEGLWIAFSAKYPMAFDEDFHLGVIRIYSEQWSPFLSGQPEGANKFGALAVDPSYLYHYLMSFPYRFISLFTDNLMIQVILLRLINVALIVSGVMLFRKVLVRAGSSELLANSAVLLFALIPAVVLVAGQINYDNLIVLALAWVCLLVQNITEQLKVRKIDIKTYGLLAIALMLSSIVKYAFLPLALVAFGYVTVMVWRTFRRRNIWKPVKKSYAELSKKWKVGLAVLLVISAGLFAQRYAVNMVVYRDPVPDCGRVIGIEACMEYGPWGRNYRMAARKGYVDPNPLAYTWVWLQGLHYRMFFMISGPPKHTNYPPSPLPSATAIVTLLFGVTGLLFYWRQVLREHPFLLFLLLLTVVYAAFLWALTNYPQYLQTGHPVAINGRYFIPLLLPLAAVFGKVISVGLRPWKYVRVWGAVAVILLFLQGGGVTGFLLRSDEAWYWPNSAVVSVNKAAKTVIDPFILEGSTKY